MFEKVLVCLDGSSLAESIIPYASEVGARFKSHLTLLRAFQVSGSVLAKDKPVQEAGGMPGHLDIPSPPAIRIQEEDETKSYLEKTAKPLKAKGIQVDCVAIESINEPVGETIVRYAKVNGMGLIVIATHGAGGARRAVFGSVADYVLRNSSAPLMVCRCGV